MGNLLTQQQMSALPDLCTTEDIQDPICHFKFFTPDSNWSWFLIELSHSDKVTAFGWVQGLENELGYFNLDELESVKGALGLSVELDTSFTPQLLSEVKKGK